MALEGRPPGVSYQHAIRRTLAKRMNKRSLQHRGTTPRE